MKPLKPSLRCPAVGFLIFSLFAVPGCRQSPAKALEPAQPAAEADDSGDDDPEAVYQQASQLLKQTEQPAAVAFGAAMMRVAADSGHTKAQSIVGFHLAQGDKKDLPAAVEYLSEAALAGDKFAAQNLRRLHDKFLEDHPDQKPKVVAALGQAAERGSVTAAAELGSMYYFGFSGLTQDYGKALPLLRQAAQAGDADAANTLGVMYAEAVGVEEDDGEGAKFFALAAERGHAKAQSSLGMAHTKGNGVPRDLVQAFKWFRLSALQNEATGKNALADFVRGLSKDQIKDGHRMVADFLRAHGQRVTAEELDEEIFNPKMPDMEELMPEPSPPVSPVPST